MLFRPRLFSSTCIFPRTIIFPRPVVYASMIPERPKISPPVGKSGPGSNSKISRSSASSGSILFSISQHKTLTTSRKLWGGMFVAIPTAIPVEPLTIKFGITEGNVKGSFNDSSKFLPHSIVFSSMFESINSPSQLNLASV